MIFWKITANTSTMSFFFQQTAPKDLDLISLWWPMLTSYEVSLGILCNLEKRPGKPFYSLILDLTNTHLIKRIH